MQAPGPSMGFRFRNILYDLWLTGPFPAGSVRILYDPHDELVSAGSLLMEKERVIESFRKGGKNVQILPLYRFRSLSSDSGGLVLHAGRTDFGEYLLRDIAHPGRSAAGFPMAHPLSVSAVTETSDHFLLAGDRSPSVVSANGRIQTLPGGFLHPPDQVAGTVEKELFEELAVSPGEVISVDVMGLARVNPSKKPEILVHVRLDAEAADILGRRGEDAWEVRRIFTVPAEAGPVRDLLRTSGSSLALASHAALAAWLFHASGICPDDSMPGKMRFGSSGASPRR